jgi:2-methylisocitrate lyase-like PEP mutase family enzyme
MSLTQNEKATRFRALHEGPGAFVIPNPFDDGSARILASVGFQALATSSAAAAIMLARHDGNISRDEALSRYCNVRFKSRRATGRKRTAQTHVELVAVDFIP